MVDTTAYNILKANADEINESTKFYWGIHNTLPNTVSVYTQLAHDVKVYFHPVYKTITINVPQTYGQYDVTGLNAQGQKLFSKSGLLGEEVMHISNLTPGIYFINIGSNQGSATKKIIMH